MKETSDLGTHLTVGEFVRSNVTQGDTTVDDICFFHEFKPALATLSFFNSF